MKDKTSNFEIITIAMKSPSSSLKANDQLMNSHKQSQLALNKNPKPEQGKGKSAKSGSARPH